MLNDKKTVLVTGATGFIGSQLCNTLQRQGYQTRALVRSMSTLGGLSLSSEVKLFQSNAAGIEAACAGTDTVLHLAGLAHVGNVSREQLWRANVEFSETIAKAAQKAGVEKLVFFSSILAAEAESRSGASDYAQSKKSAEDLLLGLSDNNFQCSILRPVNVYGPGMKGNIAALIRRIKSGTLPPLPKLNNPMALIGVQDLCSAAILVAESALSNGKIYPISDQQQYTANSLESSIYAALNRKKPGWHTPRMIFYAASLGAQIANSLGVWRNDLGLRTYRNLTAAAGHSPNVGEEITKELGFKPQHTFTGELPAILQAL